MTSPTSREPRSLSLWAYLGIVVVYLLILQGGGLLVRGLSDDQDHSLTSTHDVLINMWIPIGAALVFTYAVVAWLRWWRPVLRDNRPVQPWVRAVPAILIVAILLGINYGELSKKGLIFVLVLLVGTQFVGWGEEGMFRGIGVVTLRGMALREGQVALWSSVIFGAVHMTNIISEGIQAFAQALIVAFAGYFFYLTRRASGGNVLNSVLHGLFDFALLSGVAITVGQSASLGIVAILLSYIVLAVLLLIRRKRIEPAPSLATDDMTPTG